MPSTNLNNKTVANALSLKYGRRVEVSPVEDAAFKAEIADSTLKFIAPTPAGDAGFMLVSGAGNPHLVQRSVDNIKAVRDSVSAQTRAPILPPVVTGQAAGRTFAVWPMKRPFQASSRVMRRVKGRFYARRITQWAATLCRETLAPAASETVLRDLRVIIEDSAFPDDIRQAAEQAATRLRAGQWRPRHCLHHGDFWPENLLLPTGSGVPSFYVIDWAGMQRQGYPFLDLASMLKQLRCGAQFNAKCVKEVSLQVGCDKEDVTAYILSACGQIGANLEHFPPNRFRAATLGLYRFVKTI
jgi:Phosphotransferase enzyme family